MDDNRYLFTSARLGFRNWTEKDKAPFAQMNCDERVMRHFPSTLNSQESDQLVDNLKTHYDHHGYTYFATDELMSGKFIGFVGIKKQDFDYQYTPFVDIGWRLSPAFHGKGYATEGAKACLQYGFEEVGLKEIYAIAAHSNINSINVMKKIGMRPLDTFIHPAMDENHVLQPCVCFTISNYESVGA